MKVNWYNNTKRKTGRSNLNLATIRKGSIYFPQPVTKNYKLTDYCVANVGFDDNKNVVVRFGKKELTNARNYSVTVRTSKFTGESATLIGARDFIINHNLIDSDNNFSKYNITLHIVDKDTIYLILEK